MARYSAYLGRKVDVHYRAGDICLPARGTFIADSGRSIFLEQRFDHLGTQKTFRWEVPYAYIVRIEERPPESASVSPAILETPVAEIADEPIPEPTETKVKAAVAGAGGAPTALSFSQTKTA